MDSLKALIGFQSKNFSLLWRGSRDGFDASIFHELCDEEPDTLTLIKNTEGCVFGGYASEPWSSPSSWIYPHGTFIHDNSSFLFTLKNSANTPMKLTVIKEQYALYHVSDNDDMVQYVSTFGIADLYVASQSNTNRKSGMIFNAYEPPQDKNGMEGGNFVVGGSDYHFKTSEIEVFKVC